MLNLLVRKVTGRL